jgi:hypothetical protein
MLLVCWAVGGLNIYSGRSIANRKRRVFSLVVAGIDCLVMCPIPLPLALGVFTIVVLMRDSVKRLYGE